MPNEQIKYFREQVGKKSWMWQRLLWLGRVDTGSPLYQFPKDLISMLTRHVLNAKAHELLVKADPEMQLVFEDKK
jgi:hypothetical protein